MAKEIGYAARKKRQRENNPREGDTTMKEGNKFVFRNGKWVQAAPKPAVKKPAVGSIPPSEGTGKKAETTLGYGSGKPKPKPSPAPSTSRSSTSTSTQNTSTAPKPKPKPPAKPQPAANAGMKNQDKNYRGNPEKAGSVANTLKELRGMGSGRKVSGTGPVASGSDYAKGVASSKSSKPEDKSRYVAPDGRPYAGPAYGNDKQKSATGQSIGGNKTPSQTKKEAKKPMTLAEEIRRRRMGLN